MSFKIATAAQGRLQAARHLQGSARTAGADYGRINSSPKDHSVFSAYARYAVVIGRGQRMNKALMIITGHGGDAGSRPLCENFCLFPNFRVTRHIPSWVCIPWMILEFRTSPLVRRNSRGPCCVVQFSSFEEYLASNVRLGQGE